MNYISVREAAERWEMTPRRVQVLCNEGRMVLSVLGMCGLYLKTQISQSMRERK